MDSERQRYDRAHARTRVNASSLGALALGSALPLIRTRSSPNKVLSQAYGPGPRGAIYLPAALACVEAGGARAPLR
jgi:hypothetical protein